MKTVILAEKPSQAKAYAEAMQKSKKQDGYFEIQDPIFNGETMITWGFGHLVSPVSPEIYKEEWKAWCLGNLPMIPERFQYEVTADKKKQFNVVAKLLKSADQIVIGTDADREGENIARSIISHANAEKKTIKRLWINSLEVAEVRKGFENLRPGEDFYTSYLEAQTRQKSDWLVGMNISRLYTVLLQEKGLDGPFSVGRVQTPTLYMIYQRQQEIENFKPEPFYEVFADIQSKNGTFQGKYKERFSTKEELQALLQKKGMKQNQPGVIQTVETKEKKQAAPVLFSLSDLQSQVNKTYKASPAETLESVQALYEAKILTYPRTDCHHITEGEFGYLANNLSSYEAHLGITIENPLLEPRKRFVDGKKVQEHYAIVPTKRVPTNDELAKLNPLQKNIYEMVLRRTVGMFAPDYIFDETTIVTDLNGLLFKTVGKVEKHNGWRCLLSNHDTKEDEETTLPIVTNGEAVTATIKPKTGETKPPAYFTEGTLITAMKNAGKSVESKEDKEILKETEGIGTEATRASILETLKAQSYMEVSKNKVVVTEKGKTLCLAIAKTQLSSPAFTAEWESYLKKIHDGSGTQEVFLRNMERFIRHLIDTARATIDSESIMQQVGKTVFANAVGQCPICGDVIRDLGKFYGCRGFKNGCKFSIPKKIAGKTLPKTAVQSLLSKKKTAKIKGFKKKDGKTFEAALMIDAENKVSFSFDKK
ncbi:type IA DNA topoisomerase [Listeria booriae]|uniref:type IA DNA topoisomerase n=1 Tax=Listeria booriae TaxID=1552123 RepID=UPI0016247533|nr:type IA DNA topoisomerase [Listeria booriae]MBC1228626.1 DNA topoisomerase III [Listeria booriae]